MKDLDKFEKLKMFQEYRFSNVERHTAAVYLNAIRKGDKETVDYYESFGNDLHHILLNVRCNEKNEKYGFGRLPIEEYGWVPMGRLVDGRKVEFDIGNYITTGVSPNGTWFYGIRISTSSSGLGSGSSVWGVPYKSETDALVGGLKEMIAWYEHELEKLETDTDTDDEDDDYKTPKVSARHAFCNKIIKLSKKAIIDIKQPQLELF